MYFFFASAFSVGVFAGGFFPFSRECFTVQSFAAELSMSSSP